MDVLGDDWRVEEAHIQSGRIDWRATIRKQDTIIKLVSDMGLFEATRVVNGHQIYEAHRLPKQYRVLRVSDPERCCALVRFLEGLPPPDPEDTTY